MIFRAPRIRQSFGCPRCPTASTRSRRSFGRRDPFELQRGPQHGLPLGLARSAVRLLCSIRHRDCREPPGVSWLCHSRCRLAAAPSPQIVDNQMRVVSHCQAASSMKVRRISSNSASHSTGVKPGDRHRQTTSNGSSASYRSQRTWRKGTFGSTKSGVGLAR